MEGGEKMAILAVCQVRTGVVCVRQTLCVALHRHCMLSSVSA